MNLLMIMADQFLWNALGAAGHPVVRTPHLDGLAARGVRFANCYCNNPLCVPSRASMVTGRLTSRIGSYDNGAELPASIPTFMHCLRRAGYRTALSGKMHFIGPDQLHGFEDRLTPDIYPAAVDWTPDWRDGLKANPGSSVRKLKTSGLAGPTEQMAYDDAVASAALDHLGRLASDPAGRPFLLCVSFTHPHDPFIITREYWDRYRDDEIDLPAIPAPPPQEAHEYNRWVNAHHEVDAAPPTEAEIRATRHAYYAMISYVDDQVGRLLARLAELGLDDNTTVLFTSDHGEMLGEHGMWFKRTFYDGSAKTPLIVARPGGSSPGRCESAVVSLVDLFPTLLDLAGAPLTPGQVPALGLDGTSFAAALDGPLAGGRDTAIVEYLGEGLLRPMRCIRRGRYKYVHVHGCPPLLFDMEADPQEQTNLAGRKELAAIRESLHHELMIGWDSLDLERRIRVSQQERLLVSQALRTGKLASWDYVPPSIS